jgi:prevent-host-death family protein
VVTVPEVFEAGLSRLQPIDHFLDVIFAVYLLFISCAGNAMFSTADIYTVSEFNRKTGEHIQRLKATGRPQILTQNGKPAVVVQDAVAYEEMARLAANAESMAQVRRALREFIRGQGRSIEEAFTELDARIKAMCGGPEIQD